MNAAVLGAGLMGSVIATDLARSEGVDSVVVADIDEERLAAVRRRGGRKLSTEAFDIKDEDRLGRFFEGFDVVSSALTHGTVNAANVTAARRGVKMVDIAFEDEQMGLDSMNHKNGGLLLPGCGLAPGLGGVLLFDASRELGGAVEGHVMVGGLPQKPRPPFGYKLVFSVVGLLREYIDEARVVRAGKVVKVKPFDEVVRVDFPKPIGRCEAFYTDGLATLLYTMKGVSVMDEMTVRWPGHAEKLKAILDAGFLSKEKIRVGGTEVAPYDVSVALLSSLLKQGDPEDVTVMRVHGRKGRKEIVYEMVDFYDKEEGITSMGRTTGYTCSIVSQMVGGGMIEGSGTVPPELALGPKGTDKLISELRKRGVKIIRKRR
jgi:lysine 6-dehydrogenase